MSNFNPCLAIVLESEGGYVNNPLHDTGGRTNLGVTQAVWEAWVGHPVTETSMRALTADKVAPLYELKYWKASSADLMPHGLDLLVFSMAVNAGPGRSVKLLQRSLGVLEDGAIGPKTMGLLHSFDAVSLITKFSNTREAYYRSLKSFPVFGNGWIARCEREHLEALKMANG